MDKIEAIFKFLQGMAMCLPLTLYAQDKDESFNYNYPVMCDDTVKLMKSISETYKEEITWTGTHDMDGSFYSLWTNRDNGSWTLLKMTPSVSCILGTGNGSSISVLQSGVI